VCRHTERDAIDSALIDGAAYRDIARRFGVSRSALVRHKADHLPATLATAKVAAEEVRAGTLLDRVNALHDRALAILDRAEREGDFRVALGAIREARGVIELLVKIAGPAPAMVPTIIWDFDPATAWPHAEPRYLAEWGTDGPLPPHHANGSSPENGAGPRASIARATSQ
jgi:hypothetical protein